MEKDYSLYVHIPYCIKKCDYCDFFSVGNNSRVPDEYLSALESEIAARASAYGVDSWNTVYVGGGTPSLLSPDQLSDLLSSIRKSTKSGSFDSTLEITVEMNPETVTGEKLSVLSGEGVSRISLGVQSFVDKSLEGVGLHCSSKKTGDALEVVRKHWKRRLNLDIIAGLPGESEREFLESLDRIISYNPDHVSMYTLTVEEETPLAGRIDSGLLDFDSDLADSLWLKGRNVLSENGYRQYEVSNFSRPSMESLHNLRYWNQKNYIGCGAGACGTVYGHVSSRFTNTRDIASYVKYWSSENACADHAPGFGETLDMETREFEYLMMGFRTLRGISSSDYGRLFSSDLRTRLGNVWKDFSDRGLCRELPEADGGTRFSLNENGILLLNRFLVEL